MFNKILDVKTAFINVFLSAPIVVNVKGVNKTIPVRYAKKSADDYTEEDLQQTYPVISIWDHEPKKSDMWGLTGFSYTANERESVAGVSGIDTATQFYEPILLNFRFDVGCATKSFFDEMALEDYFLKNFIYEEHLVLNPIVVNGDQLGETVAIEVVPVKIERPDGIIETNYEFNFNAWVYIKDPEDVTLITTLNIQLTPQLFVEQDAINSGEVPKIDFSQI